MLEHNPPQSLYKFFKWHRFISLISTGELYFSNPLDFNDPYDCIQQLDFPSSSEGDINDFILKMASDQRKKLTPADLLSLRTNITLLNNFYRKAGKTAARNVGVTCFTEKLQSFPMWAHYADNHKGVAVEFSSQHLEKLHPMINLWPVSYTSTFPTVGEWMENEKKTSDDNLPFLKMLLTRKCDQWKQEQEWRLVNLQYPSQKTIKYGTQIITKIFLGAQVKQKNITIIKNLLSQKELNHSIFQMKISSNLYGFSTKAI